VFGRPHPWAALAIILPMASGCWVTQYEWCSWLYDSGDSGEDPSIFDNGGSGDCEGHKAKSLDEVNRGVNEAENYEWKQVAAGSFATCGLTTAGDIHCWGNDNKGVLEAPTGTFQAITLNGYTGCGLRASGAAVCWGDDDHNQVQSAGGAYLQIELGEMFGCGLTHDGLLDCWGDLEPFSNDTQVEPLVQFATDNGGPTCGVTTSGSIECWCHTVRLPHMDTAAMCDPVAGDDFTAVAVSSDRGCGLREDNTLDCWGVGYAHDEPYSRGIEFTAIEFGENGHCGLTTDDTLTCWYDGKTPPSGTYTQLSVGYDHSCAVTTDNKIRCWGDNSAGQSDPP
jgi:alpha-tubulin suppressor-like RCC1 family protein